MNHCIKHKHEQINSTLTERGKKRGGEKMMKKRKNVKSTDLCPLTCHLLFLTHVIMTL